MSRTRPPSAVALHVVGAADLGVEPGAYEGALAAFLAAPPAERRRMLLTPRPEAHHASAPPIQSLILHARERIERVALLATDQRGLPEADPRRRKDNRRLWAWRNGGPLAHKFWATVPIGDVDLAIDRGIGELVACGLVPPGHERRTLVAAWRRLRKAATG